MNDIFAHNLFCSVVIFSTVFLFNLSFLEYACILLYCTHVWKHKEIIIMGMDRLFYCSWLWVFPSRPVIYIQLLLLKADEIIKANPCYTRESILVEAAFPHFLMTFFFFFKELNVSCKILTHS